MEAFGVLKFWWNSATGADVASYAADFRSTDDEEEPHADDSFFDLVFTSPDDVAAAKKDLQFIESPRDVFADSNRICPVTLLRSSPKFKILMLGFRKSSICEKTESNGEIRGKSSSVKCRLKGTSDYEIKSEKLSRGYIPKYLKLIKPLYLKVWKRNEKTGSLTPSASPAVDLSPRKSSESSRMGNFRIASMRLRKSRSASAAVGMAPFPVNRRDDSLLERHDGIQSAVLYCKKSYNSSSSKEFSQLFQSSSRDPCEEPKRCSI